MVSLNEKNFVNFNFRFSLVILAPNLKFIITCSDGVNCPGRSSSDLANLVVSNVLLAMADGSRRAQLMFPDVLHLLRQHPQSRVVFADAVTLPYHQMYPDSGRYRTRLDVPLLDGSADGAAGR